MAPRPVYPFCAIVGQEEMKLALILATISPDLSGVLIRGEKGTAKSTAVRALASVLPEQRVASECRFGCDPDRDEDCPDGPHEGAATTRPARLVELPVGASEDRLTGSLSGKVVVAAGDEDRVVLILDNATIASSSGAAIEATSGDDLVRFEPEDTFSASWGIQLAD
ncbi:MAG: hypothetical protein DI600_02340 [Cutibacterium granulosum]|nr:MAG: hypothetical protein DI600_02340 [Cutibacterium granulosum]